jgi:PAS domain S-box-containing protein
MTGEIQSQVSQPSDPNFPKGTEMLAGLLLGMQDARDPHLVLERMLGRVVKWMKASRGDFALWDEEVQDLRVAAIEGERIPGMTKDVGDRFPKPSFVRGLWQDQSASYWISRDVKTEQRPYHVSDARTNSEIAIRLTHDGKHIGVLNVESFVNDAFKEHDREFLQRVAPYATVAVQIARRDARLWNNIRRVLEHSPALASSLDAILESVFTFHHLNGVVYVSNDDRQKLEVSAAFGDPEVKVNTGGFAYQYSEPAAATRVRRSGEAELIDNAFDPESVNQTGRKCFHITGPLAVLPLQYAERCVGVLVAWKNSEPYANRDHLRKLKLFADLAAAKIAMSKAEKEIRDSEELYHSLVETVPLPLYRKDLDEKFTMVNQAFCQYAGQTREFILSGKTDFDLFATPNAQKFQSDDKQLIGGHLLPFQVEEPNQPLSTGEMRWVKVAKSLVQDSHKQVIGTQGIFWDITAEREAREARDELQRYCDFCLHSFGNELLNLDSSLFWGRKLWETLVARGQEPPAELAKWMKFQRLGLGALHFYLTHVQKFLRAELQMVPVEIKAILQDEVHYLREALEDELDAHLAVEIPEGVQILCDKEFFVAAIKEFFRNSAKSIYRRRTYSSANKQDVEKGRIVVKLEHATPSKQIRERHLKIAIIDNGEPCVRPERKADLRKTWEAICAGQTPSRAQKGLSFVKWVVEKHQGHLAFDESSMETAFHIHIPIVNL